MAKSKNVEAVGQVAKEDTSWERFMRDTKADLRVMTKLLNARAAKDRGTRAAEVYDHLLLQLMNLYVSPAALERYRRGFTEDEINLIDERDDTTAAVVRAENGMMIALKRMVAANPLHRQAAYDDFVNDLYFRWQYVMMSKGAGIEAMSADGVNVARE
ncbi:hypothetical protein [Variovorax boronicumulans]|uniref:hypothetical protein n=1 Tax=Variovorax boronicumulans TaxID=436515 RepID=UPI00085CB21A|nr:hypothetical protein [Variovorax boronicumulans]OEZ31481.1 hypothetical protein AO062_08880 [Variovorax boronicumulans]